MKGKAGRGFTAFLLTVAFCGVCHVAAGDSSPLAVTIPARMPEPLRGHLRLGGRNPAGVEINANSQYLTWDGRPWMPVMGEFHFSRYPCSEWEEELLKMKAAGVTVVATYFFWNHHEEQKGKFDWSGDRDARRFAEHCAKHGLLLYLRLGPWCHGECRNGGFPDWLLTESEAEHYKLRGLGPRYMDLVRAYYAQIGAQLKGLLWKDGGPVIGAQVENELTRDPAYLLALKNMARDTGLDLPLYTMTGWGRAQIPPDELIPLFGYCLDNFWDDDTTSWDRSCRQNYIFENSREDEIIGMGLLPTAPSARPNPLARYPYLTCETGGGVQVSYTRRPYIAGSDAGPLSLTKLGSGSNLPGYYMFQGGSNPMGKLSSLQESLDSGYPNDMPVISYDSQAPLREFGQINDSYNALRILNLFVDDFGSQLAPMHVILPEEKTASIDDTNTLRWSVRSDGRSGFIFINNYQRVESLPPHESVRLQLKLSHESLELPHEPLNIPTGATMIWPFNMEMNGALLKYATAQPLCRLADGASPCYVFFATAGGNEFVFDAGTVDSISASGARQTRQGAAIRIDGLKPGLDCAFSVKARGGAKTRILLISAGQALESCKASMGGKEHLFVSPAALMFDGERLRLQSREPQDLRVEVFPPFHAGRRRLFAEYRAKVSPRAVETPIRLVKEAAPALPPKTLRGKPQAPGEADFERAAVWQVSIPQDALENVHEVILSIDYAGDVGRAYLDHRLIADDFYDGRPWEIGLHRFAPGILGHELTLKILPLRRDASIYIAAGKRPDFGAKSDLDEIRHIRAIPVYESVLEKLTQSPAPPSH